jgi:hypothetical protein
MLFEDTTPVATACQLRFLDGKAQLGGKCAAGGVLIYSAGLGGSRYAAGRIS